VQAGDGRPSYDELAVLVVQQAAVIEELRADNVALRSEVADLKHRLGLNSRNSSKPPSSDGLAKPALKSLRGKTTRSAGGQKGHPGSTLAQVVTPDEVAGHEPWLPHHHIT
jgi:transposase